MPEVKNIFVGAKMNKDLNPRMISNQEYIDARNAAIINSEGSDSGLLQNVSGNTLLTDFGLTGINLEIIGFYIDPTKNILYSFVTDWNDTSADQSSRFASSTSSHYICAYDTSTNTGTILVSGSFLNFSKTSPMLGINLLEDLLFFTDNRNQPRKINVVTAATPDLNYYTKEHHISVAKYYPWTPMRLSKYTPSANPYSLLINSILNVSKQPTSIDDSTPFYTGVVGTGGFISETGTGATIQLSAKNNIVSNVQVLSGGESFTPGVSIITIADGTLSGQVGEIKILILEENIDRESTMKDVTSENLPYSINPTVLTASGSPTISFTVATGVSTKWVGAIVTQSLTAITVRDNVTISSITTGATDTIVINNPNNKDFNLSEVTIGANPYYDEVFDGDSEFLSDKFARFSYRFKYDDDEYSLMAPFSQAAFIPKQDGYFLDKLIVPTNVNDEVNISDENRAIKSTIVSFFENKVNSMELVIDKPSGVALFKDIIDEFKVQEIEILYKQSDQVAIKVVDTIRSSDISSASGLQYLYKYESSLPIRTLPSNATTRASDKVPIIAKAQEISGNRVIYGNYLARTTRPTLSYRTFSSVKAKKGDLNSVNQIEYPNHNLKQNRSYKVGVVLSDYFGRQSDVITSSNSALYSNYRSVTDASITADNSYLGDSIKIIWDNQIPELKQLGYAGIYSESNPLGWYTYKIVVQQQEQDYYNVYLPTILNNYPQDATTTTSSDTAFITLFSDNINKVPRDLKEVGPQQLQFSSSVNLFARVTNTTFSATLSTTKQYQPSKSPDTVTLIGTRDDIGVNLKIDGDNYNVSPFFSVPKVYIPGDDTGDPIIPIVRNIGSNPYIAKVSTQDRVGATGATASTVTFEKTRLNVYETEPFESSLDIFWETSSSGVISDLNTSIFGASDESQPFKISGWDWILTEAAAPITEPLAVPNSDATEEFDVENRTGILLAQTTTVTANLVKVVNGSGTVVTNLFRIVQNPINYKWKIQLIDPLVFIDSSYNSTGNWSFTIKFTNVVAGEIYEQTLTEPIGNNILGNVTPSLYVITDVNTPNNDQRIGANRTVNKDVSYPNTKYLMATNSSTANFYVSNGTFTLKQPPTVGVTPDFDDPRISEQLLVTLGKVEVATAYDSSDRPIQSSFVEYKPINPIAPWSEYISIVGSNSTGYKFLYNSNFTRVDIRGYQAGDNLNPFSQFYVAQTPPFPPYNPGEYGNWSSSFRITVNLIDANQGPGHISLQSLDVNFPNAYTNPPATPGYFDLVTSTF